MCNALVSAGQEASAWAVWLAGWLACSREFWCTVLRRGALRVILCLVILRMLGAGEGGVHGAVLLWIRLISPKLGAVLLVRVPCHDLALSLTHSLMITFSFRLIPSVRLPS
jgi:hypothetical protein